MGGYFSRQFWEPAWCIREGMHARLRRPTVELFSIPTERPESDGTLAWDASEMVLVEVHAHRSTGLGYFEFFHDHARVEGMLFDGAPMVRQGALWPDLSRPGLGIELKASDARRWAA